MIVIAPEQRADMIARHAARRPDARTATAVAPRARNLAHVLDLGNVVFFAFRGRAYGVPPLPWTEGELILEAWNEARACVDTDSEYFAAIARLPGLIWRNVQPVGRLLRRLRQLGMLRNPFQRATEAELFEVAAFLLSRRMKSGVHFQPSTAPAKRRSRRGT